MSDKNRSEPSQVIPDVAKTPIAPRVMTLDEVEIFKLFRTQSLPTVRSAALDEFAKWIFTSVSVIGSLGLALAATAIKSLDFGGMVFYGIAILLTGISLGWAVWARTADLGSVNTDSPVDLQSKWLNLLVTKRRYARRSGFSFLLAVVVAGAVPILTFIPESPKAAQGITYSLGKDGVRAATFLATKPNSIAELQIFGVDANGSSLLAAQRSAADVAGALKLEAATTGLSAGFSAVEIRVTEVPNPRSIQNLRIPIVGPKSNP